MLRLHIYHFIGLWQSVSLPRWGVKTGSRADLAVERVTRTCGRSAVGTQTLPVPIVPAVSAMTMNILAQVR